MTSMSTCAAGSAGRSTLQSSTWRSRTRACRRSAESGGLLLGAGGPGGAEAVAVGAGLDDVGVEDDAVDDGGDEAGIADDSARLAEGQVRGDGDAGLLFAFG